MIGGHQQQCEERFAFVISACFRVYIHVHVASSIHAFTLTEFDQADRYATGHGEARLAYPILVYISQAKFK